ncbi:uncharacterized protein LOC110176057 [Drosophila serrata]|uniref:uncharacterized protein LOC110176057 n=1 Tax=Drosophila serrata TaxID=7274 RepID=UPI000A1D1919|nr:uncharacterized protein LOC110176057 [Drosophila serrata]
MKQDISPDRDDCITPLTIAAIEEEHLAIWLSEDDDDSEDSSEEYSFAPHDTDSDDVTSSDDEMETTPAEPIELIGEVVEQPGAYLYGIIQEYIRDWNDDNEFSEGFRNNIQVSDNLLGNLNTDRILEKIETLEDDPLMENIENDMHEDMFTDHLNQNMDTEEHQNIFSDQLVENMEAEVVEDIFSDHVMENVNNEENGTMFSDRLMENLNADEYEDMFLDRFVETIETDDLEVRFTENVDEEYMEV